MLLQSHTVSFIDVFANFYARQLTGATSQSSVACIKARLLLMQREMFVG